MEENIPQAFDTKPKKRKIILIALCVVLVILIGVFAFTLVKLNQSNNSNSNNNPSVQEIELENNFDIDIFKQLFITNEKDLNTVVSPLSIKIAMSMAAEGAQGETLSEMQGVLDTNEDSRSFFKSILDRASDYDDVEINIANSIWIRDELEFKNEFLNILEEYYDAEAQSLDFSDSASKDIINNWVSDKTNEKIPSILEKINPLDIAFLINAIYFNAEWQEAFDKEFTREEEFTLIDESKVDIELMSLDSNFNYFEDNELQAIELPYGQEGDYSMKVYLPKRDNSITDFIENLTAEKLEEWNDSFDRMDGLIELPRFKTEYSKDLSEILIKLGIVKAFDDVDADFSKMIEIMEGNNVYIGRVKHKTYIDVTEEGTEAAAVTMVEMMVGTAITERPERFEMIVNKPFLFTIEDNINNQILFIGTILDPTK